VELIVCAIRSRARTNGVTQTFRRSSTATTLPQQRDGNQATSNLPFSSGSVYVPPHLNSNYHAYNRNGASAESRYSKDQLLDMFRTQKSRGLSTNIDDLYVDGWTPGVNGTSNGGWGKSGDHKEMTGPDICWDYNGSVQPMAWVDMSEEEKEVKAAYNLVSIERIG